MDCRKGAAVAADHELVHGKEEEKAMVPPENLPDLMVPKPDAAPLLQPSAEPRAFVAPEVRRGAAPPAGARVAPPGNVVVSDDEEEWRDVQDGQDAPMTPRVEEDPTDMYEPSSLKPEPMHIGHLQALTVLGDDGDLQPAVSAVSTREDMAKEII